MANASILSGILFFEKKNEIKCECMSTLFHCNTCQDAFWYLDYYFAKYHLRKTNCLTFLSLNLP